MKNLSAFILLAFFASYTGASLHAAEFGLGEHDHYGHECQLNTSFTQPIDNTVLQPEIAFHSADEWIAPFAHYFLISPYRLEVYISRAPPELL